METNMFILQVVFYVAGVIVSIVFPYFLSWLQETEPFDWRMNVGRVLVALMALVPFLASAEFAQQLAGLNLFGAFALGIGFSQLGRIVQKAGGAFGTARA